MEKPNKVNGGEKEKEKQMKSSLKATRGKRERKKLVHNLSDKIEFDEISSGIFHLKYKMYLLNVSRVTIS